MFFCIVYTHAYVPFVIILWIFSEQISRDIYVSFENRPRAIKFSQPEILGKSMSTK